MGHTSGEIHHLRCIRNTRGNIDNIIGLRCRYAVLEIRIIVEQRIIDSGPLRAAERRCIDTDRTQGVALVTHQALIRYIIDFLLVMTTQETDEIDRRVLQILLLDIHRTRIQTQAAA